MIFLMIIGERDFVSPSLSALTIQHVEPGLRIYGDQPVHHRPDGMIIVGSIYRRENSDNDLADDQYNPFSRLIQDYWGSYVATRRREPSSDPEVFVDPSGSLPCYCIELGGALYLGSDARTVLLAAGAPVEIHWEGVAFQLLRRDMRGPVLGLKRVTEIQAGTLARFAPGKCSVRRLWSPRQFLERPRYPATFEQSAKNLRYTINDAIRSMFSSTGKVLVGLSGGLDSSIVAAGLAAWGFEFSCFTMFSEGDDSDERRYAQRVADHLGVTLVAYPYRIEDVDLEKSAVATFPRAIGWPFQQSLERTSILALGDTKANAIARGTGGDSVFCHNNSAAPIIDALLQDGTIAALSTIRDVCEATGASIWTATRLAVRRASGAGRRPIVRVDESLLTSDCYSLEDAYRPHLWVEESVDLLPGKQRHVDAICAIQTFLAARLTLDADVLCPLLCQPVVETALEIASPQWVRGGRNRAVAREAYRDRLPASIIERTTKGGPDAFAAALYRANQQKVREILMDGELVRQNIVNRDAVELATSISANALPPSFGRLLALVDAEAWVRHWQGVADQSLIA